MAWARHAAWGSTRDPACESVVRTRRFQCRGLCYLSLQLVSPGCGRYLDIGSLHGDPPTAVFFCRAEGLRSRDSD